MLNIKIFVAHNKENSITVDNSLYQNIKVGHIDSSTKFISDNTGDNISTKYDKYCELTAQYWAWKNSDADYYGLCTEDKYLSFAKNDIRNNINKPVKYPYLNKEPIVEAPIRYEYLNSIAIEQMNLFEQPMIEEITKYDMLITTSLKFDITVMEQFENYVPLVEDNKLKLTLEVIKELSPQMYPSATSYIYGNIYYPGQLYIMKKELFHEYCTWSFALLEELENRIDFTNCSEEGYKILYYISERLLGIYYIYIQNQNKYNLKELDWCTIEYIKTQSLLMPIWDNNKSVIVLASSEQYIVPATAAIKSIIDNSNIDDNYDIVFLHKNLNKKNKDLLLKIVSIRKNFNLRFYDVGYDISCYKMDEFKSHWDISTFFKLLIPKLFINYEKAIWLDSDVIVLNNIMKLIKVDLQKYLIGAVRSWGPIFTGDNIENNYRIEYTHKKLGLEDIYYRINAGVVLFNLQQINNSNITSEILLKEISNNYIHADEDIINKVFKEKIYFLDACWNTVVDSSYMCNVKPYLANSLYIDWNESIKTPKIIHYAGYQKPWNYPNMDFAQYWWDTVRGTELYELAINSQIINITTNYTKKAFKDCPEMLENKKGW
ncbi:hypothetical protein AN642_01345 [Epulopiscium sp. SCG-B10WGA-EpuloA2]|nr:hypothetical protein AN642_01345 [Epulopiscium sp. SCG-B10WGA-EpuloA2]